MRAGFIHYAITDANHVHKSGALVVRVNQPPTEKSILDTIHQYLAVIGETAYVIVHTGFEYFSDTAKQKICEG